MERLRDWAGRRPDRTPAPTSTFAALTLYPRLEATGTVARRFIQAEPLLEEGLALALAYTDLVGVGAALDTPR